ncbi:MAG: ATP phosphoribosyltransferase regulatory subunit [Candidatus Nezhaarchaeales archaeon]|nr:MAG: ATP phosphoribosyltransferase regulatory subunit [Candidatus Nezhaarchaeota archaeon WYZ-LMO7]
MRCAWLSSWRVTRWLGGLQFTQIPRGTRDLVPPYSEAFRYVEAKLLETFTLWGYREVKTPLFEYLDSLSRGVGSSLVQSMFKVQDDDGRLIAFRAEMTTPVARLVSSKMLKETMPLRLCYVNNVVRFKESYPGYPRELWQAGIELIGYRGVDADAEVILLMLTSLNELGLNDVKVDVGHAGIFKRLLALAELKEENAERVKSFVSMRDSTGLKSLLRKSGCDESIVRAFELVCELRGLKVIDEIVSILGDKELLKQVEEVRLLFKLLEKSGLQSKVSLDLGLVRGLDYYTGIIFEPYTSTFGRALGGGGRYDDLIASFAGVEVPATGFALIVDYLVEAVGVEVIAQRLNKRKRVIIVPASYEHYEGALARAQSLRDQGIIVELHPINDIEGARAKAEKIGAILEVVE